MSGLLYLCHDHRRVAVKIALLYRRERKFNSIEREKCAPDNRKRIVEKYEINCVIYKYFMNIKIFINIINIVI